MELRFSRHLSEEAMSPISEAYQRQAAYAMEMAERAASEELRAQWLYLACKWLDMVPSREPSAKQAFDQALHDRGTHQKDSKASH
jgi:hypothetical protein